jgi:ATP:ADP antiporter, AAA family
MKDRLFKLMGIESGEESMISLLLTQSVFLGIFFGAFDISAHSFFLSIFDEKMMARGYVLSGLAGIILTSLYTLLQTKIQFRKFATINLFFVTALTLVLWILLMINPAKWVIWLVFIMLGPLNILAMLGFWGTVGRLFTLRQGKRLFGLVDAGLILGIILSCYAIPVLLSLNFKPHNILLISTGALFIGSIIQIIIGNRFNLSHGKSEKETEVKKEKTSFLSVFRQDSYIRTMAIFIALSVVTAFFVQYSFMAVTREQYPAEEDMARFLGLFTGSMMIFTLLIKLLVFSYLIKNYGLRTCLALTPFLIAAFTVIAVLIGLIKGYTPAAGLGFMLFFMLLAMSRLFSKSLKDSIESPSFKVIYQTIDENIRYEVQSGMDGTINEIAALSSGLILAGLGLLSFVRLIHFSVVLIIIAALWVFIASKLYSGYRNSIRKALEAGGDERGESARQSGLPDLDSRFSATLAFKSDYFNIVSGKYDSLQNKRTNYYDILIEAADSEKDINLLPALKKIASDTSLEQGIRHSSDKTAESLELLTGSFHQKDEKIFEARKILADSRQPQTTQILRLLRDNSLDSRRLAIYMIGKFRMTDMLPEVCGCLNIHGLEVQAKNVLKSFGKEADEELRRYYLLSSGNVNISKTILRLLGENCSPENQSYLFSRLWSNSRQLREVALIGLIGCKFSPTEEERDRLHQLISDIIGIMVWNLSAKITLEKENATLLLEALNKEISRWNDFLFNLLSITYDSGSISRIRENLESGTVESVNYALEMIDMVIDESIKPKIIPLLDVIPDEEKVKHLFQFFPGVIPDFGSLIEDIINRDYNLLGVWIRACALRYLQMVESESLAESLVALLFSPEIILQEESALLLARSGRDLYNQSSQRIPADARSRLNKIVGGETSPEELVYNKVLFLSSCFTGTDEEDQLFIAGAMNYAKKITPDVLPAYGGYVLWSGNIENVKIIYESKNMSEEIVQPGVADLFYILPLLSVEEYYYNYSEKSVNILNYINNKEK